MPSFGSAMDGTCTTNDQCHEGKCNEGKCLCDFWFSGDHCTEKYSHQVGWLWSVFRGGVFLVHGVTVVLCIVLIIRRAHGRWEVRTKLDRALVEPQRLSKRVTMNLRDAIVFMILLASIGRLVWIIDPVGFQGIYPNYIAQTVLLHIPQIIWLNVYLFSIMLMQAVRQRVGRADDRIGTGRRTSIMVSLMGVIFLCGSALPLSFLQALAKDNRNYLYGDLANGVITLYAIILACFAAYTLARWSTLVGRFRDRTDLGMNSLRSTLHGVLESTRALLMPGFIASMLIVALVGWMVVNNVSAHEHKDQLIIILFGIHLLAEPLVCLSQLASSADVRLSMVMPRRMCCKWMASILCCGWIRKPERFDMSSSSIYFPHPQVPRSAGRRNRSSGARSARAVVRRDSSGVDFLARLSSRGSPVITPASSHSSLGTPPVVYEGSMEGALSWGVPSESSLASIDASTTTDSPTA